MNTGRTAGTCRGAAESPGLSASGLKGLASWPFLILFALLCMVLGTASYPFLVPDEARHAGIVHDMWAARQYLMPRINGFPTLDGAPLHYWVSLLFLAVLGPNEWVLRLPSALAAVALLVFLGRIFLPLSGARIAVLFLMQPALLLAGRFAAPDMLNLLLLTLAMGGFLRVVQHQEAGETSWLAVLGAWGATGMLGLSCGPLAVILPVIMVTLWLGLRRRPDLLAALHWGVGLAVVMLLLLPWLITVETRHPGIVLAMLSKQSASVLGGWRHGWTDLGHSFCALLVLLGALPLLVACLSRCRRSIPALRSPTAGFMAVWLLVMAPLHVLMVMSAAGHAVALVVPLLYFATLLMQPEAGVSAKKRVAYWLTPALLALALVASGVHFLSKRLSSIPPLARQLSQFYNPTTDKAIMLDRYDYDFNFYLRSPKLVYVATNWQSAASPRSPWKQGFFESARFVPQTAERMILHAGSKTGPARADTAHDTAPGSFNPESGALFERLCERRPVNLWVISASDSALRHPILESFPVYLSSGGLSAWFLSAGREPKQCVAWALRRAP